MRCGGLYDGLLVCNLTQQVLIPPILFLGMVGALQLVCRTNRQSQGEKGYVAARIAHAHRA